MASKKLYINVPGGAILQMASGIAESFDYGQKVDLDELSEAQRRNLAHVTSTKQPGDAPADPSGGGLRAARIEANQINSTASPIPGNYGDLTEDEAVRLILNCRDPQVQAVLVAHEIATQGREKVINAAPSEVRDEAEVRAAVAEYEAEAANEVVADSPTAQIGDGEGGGPGASAGNVVPVAPPVPGATPPPTQG